MPQILTVTGTSDQAETAYLNALGGAVGPMNDGAESRIVSRSTEQTPNGVVVTLQIVIYSEEELLEMEPELEDEESGGKTGAVSHERREHMNIGDYLFVQSQAQIHSAEHALQEMVIDDMAHPEHSMPHPVAAPPVEAEFEEAAYPSDASYVHASSDHDNEGGRIVTELAEQEIEDAVRHDVLSAGVVVWSDRELSVPSAPELTPEEELFQKDAKKRRPSVDNLDLVA